MSLLDAARYRLGTLGRALFRRAAFRRELDEEIAFHLELDAMQRRHAGAAPDDASRDARRRFGRPERVRERVVDATGASALDALGQDARLAGRALRREPAFALVAVVTLALGIGATTAIFSVVEAVLLRPLPFPEGDRIVLVGEVGPKAAPGERAGTVSFPNFDDWRRGARSLEAMALFNEWSPSLTGAGEPARLRGALVTAGVFDALRVAPALGRPILPADNVPGAAPVAVLSDAFWRRRFGADPSVVGRALTTNGVPRTVVGVLPAGLRPPGALDAELWGNNYFDSTDTRGARYLSAIARLAPGATLEGARAELRAIAARLSAAYPENDAGWSAAVTPLREAVAGDARRPLLLLLGASGLVLLVACANLSNLLIARGLARGREFALRAALGAGRWRVLRQVLVESTALALCGAAAGLALAALGVRAALRLAPEAVRAQPVSVDPAVLGFALAVTVVTGVLAGLAPAWRAARADPQAALKGGGRGTTDGAGLRARDALAVTQLALALALLAGAGLLVKSLVRLQRVDPGVRAEGVLALSLNLPTAKYPRDALPRTVERLVAAASAVPGVRSAAVTSILPFAAGWDRVGVDVYGRPRGHENGGAVMLEADRYIVTPAYFRTLGIPLRAGRLLAAADDGGGRSPLVVLVDEVFARRLAPNGSPIGLRVSTGDGEWRTVVGVVGHVRHYGLEVPSGGQIYLPQAQVPWRWLGLVVRADPRVAPASLAPGLRAAVRALDPDQPVFGVTTLDAMLAELGAPRRFVLVLLGAFAGVALLLAGVGLYGVVAYGVARRARELGVRVTLGATPAAIRRAVVGRGVRLALAGAALGTLGALAGGRLLVGALFGVRPADPGVLAGVAALLVAAAALASWVPARRATRVDPAVVLRGE